MKRVEDIYEQTVMEKGEHRKSKEYKRLSPKMKDAVDSIFKVMDAKPSDFLNSFEKTIKDVSKRYKVSEKELMSYFEREMHSACELLQRMDSGFHRRLKNDIVQSHADNVVFTLAALEAFLPDNEYSFQFLSTVEFLRQPLTHDEQDILHDDIFSRETEMWNPFVGPRCRCDLLVNTHCSDEPDDVCFSACDVAWSDRQTADTPLLVQCVDSDISFSAMLHRYSGVREFSVGVPRQCCISGCTHSFLERQPS